MSVLPMKRVLIAGLRKDRKRILELLQRRGDLEIRLKTDAAETFAEDTVFAQTDVAGQKASFERNAQSALNAIAALDAVSPGAKDGGMFAGRQRMPLSQYESSVGKRDRIMEVVNAINALNKKNAELQAEIPKYEDQIEALTPWMSFALPLDFDGTKETKAFIGTLPNETDLASLQTALHTLAPDITGADAEIISASKEQTCVCIICLRRDASAVEEALRHMNFARPTVSGGVPAKQKEVFSRTLADLKKEMEENNAKIASYRDAREQIKFVADYFRLRADKYEVIGSLYQSKRTFLLPGYVPAGSADELEQLLTSQFDCVVEFTDPDPNDEDVPVLLSNNWFAAPVEGVVAGYSLPNRHEIDPSFMVSLFYYILFGLMLSDAGYGLVMAIGSYVMLRKNKETIEEGMRKTLTMFLYCGIATAFWGLMFGSFFGDTVSTVATNFFHRPDIAFPALWLVPVEKPITVLGFSFIIGIIHIFAGLGILIYQNLKEGDVMGAVCGGVLWYLLIGGAVVFLLSTEMIRGMFGLSFVLPHGVVLLSELMMLVGAVGILLFDGRSSKNWFKRIAKGLYSLYGVSSYLSDILSYSRLLALGLATSVISSVFNQMGTLAGDGVVGWIVFILMFSVGHTMNILINALGAYVHTNRLQYVEFFGKFYNGGGRAFSPFKENTKYYKITE